MGTTTTGELSESVAGDLNTAPAARWQPIETAPKDGTRFLGLWRGIPEIVSWIGPNQFGLSGWASHFGVNSYYFLDGVSAWSPFPRGPARGAE